MAKNKLMSWMNAFQGLKEFAGIALYSFRKTSVDAWKAFMENKAILEKPKEAQSQAEKVGLEAIRKMQLQKLETLKAELEKQNGKETYGIFTDPPNRKPGSKQ